MDATDHDFRFHLSRKAFYTLLAASWPWFTVNETPVLPVGLLFAIHYVGTNYEVTFFRSLAAGRKVVLSCLGVALLGLLLCGPRAGFSVTGEGVRLELALRFSLLQGGPFPPGAGAYGFAGTL